MSERIDKLKYEEPELPSTRERRESSLFLTGPAEFLCRVICEELRAIDAWKAFFGENIDPYKRMDYSMRALPALRVFVPRYQKEFESWFINGNVAMDIILPPAIRRAETEQIPATVAAALLQQFRSPKFFNTIDSTVPGLNELGKTVDVDKELAFAFEQEMAPLVRIEMNFRIDLREWDDYAESDYRTKDDPFERTLADLRRLATTVRGIDEDGNPVDVQVEIEQNV